MGPIQVLDPQLGATGPDVALPSPLRKTFTHFRDGRIVGMYGSCEKFFCFFPGGHFSRISHFSTLFLAIVDTVWYALLC